MFNKILRSKPSIPLFKESFDWNWKDIRYNRIALVNLLCASKLGGKIDEEEKAEGPFYVFLGDLAEKGKGKLFISMSSNSQLKTYERYL